jgi:hypothetical protein
MEKKNVLSLGLLFLALLVIAGSVYYLFTQRDIEVVDEDPVDNDTPFVMEPLPYDNLSLTYDYIGENVWEYQVTGTVPNPCYEVSVEPQVAESFPEQVRVLTLVMEPSPDEMCAQVIQEVYEEGTFQASEEAEIIHGIELVAPTFPREVE